MELSFLIGAGFSVPEGIPTRRVVNERLRQISHDEIYFDSAGNAGFLNGQVDVNAHWMGMKERLFVERFLNFYSNRVIPFIDNFDYEEFYDYFSSLQRGDFKSEGFDELLASWNERSDYPTHAYQALDDFKKIFNQLIAGLLHRRRNLDFLSKPYAKYDFFLNFIDDIKSGFDKIHFHTLNHDLLMEEISNSHAMNEGVSDGYTSENSPFIGEGNDGSEHRLRYFNNSFDKKFNIYKLHGSTDSYTWRDQKSINSIKIPWGVSHVQIHKEVTAEDGTISRDLDFFNYYPDFLSGTTEKILSYGSPHYYHHVFDQFIRNLKHSDLLLLVGYGLGDNKINEFIIEHFIKQGEGRKVIVVAPEKHTSVLYEYPNVIHYGVGLGVADLNEQRLKEILAS